MKKYNVLFFLIIFMATLRSYLWGGLPILSLFAFTIALLFVLLNFERIRVPRGYYLYLLYIISIVGIIYLGTLVYGVEIDAKRLVGINVFLITLMISPLIIDYINPRIIKAVIFVHLTFFYIQFLAYYIFGLLIDFVVVGEDYSRNMGGIFRVPLLDVPLMRASGLFTEPGNYANYMFLLYSLLFAYSHKHSRDSRMSDTHYILFLCSLVLSFSTFGLIFALVIILLRTKSLVPMLITASLFSFLVAPFYLERFSGDADPAESGLGFRGKYIADAVSNFESVEGWIAGKGTLSATPFFQPREGSDNDSGLLFFLLREMGIIPTLMLLALVLMQPRGRVLALMLACLFSKLTLYSFFVPLVFSAGAFKNRLVDVELSRDR